MSRAATSRLKVNPPLGRMPVLQFIPPAELKIDETYQRSLEASTSQSLIRKIAQFWNWDLCQPLVVARREGGKLFVIDGQHRLAASVMRRDIAQLPCVVLEYANAADEAASFVHLNQQRRPLTKLDLFKAAIASEDPEAVAIVAAIKAAGLSVAPHSNYTAWKPGMVSNIGGIESAWRTRGANATTAALKVLALAYRGEVLRYAGTIFPGIAAVCSTDHRNNSHDRIVKMVGARKQTDWRTAIGKVRLADPSIKFAPASAKVFLDAWAKAPPPPSPPSPPHVARCGREPDRPASVTTETTGDNRVWCAQCEQRMSVRAAVVCKSKFCKARPGVRK